jgi:hypothetical protein
MNGMALTPLQRIGLAFYALFAVLFRTDVALAVRAARQRRKGGALPEVSSAQPAPAGRTTVEAERPGPEAARLAAAPPQPAGPSPESVSRRAALQLLGVLQREGRLVDFIEEDLTGFPDAAVGAAARTVHEGCKRAIQELFRLEPVLRQPEGAVVEVAPGFDPGAVRLTGNVVGKPPFKGSLRHHGWRAQDVTLPPPPDGMDPAIVAPAEVEL